jgi:bifunctional DNA-binding transcriptional regulator/antitoxin component of YhaV-PrlF toxin-antitoxin module
VTRREFEVELEGVEGMDATRIRIPFDVREAFGRARPPVRGTVAGVPYRSTPAVYGSEWFMVVRKEVREAAGASAGDIVLVVMEEDEQPREVAVPEALARALDMSPEAREFFAGLSYTHRKEYAQWVSQAKREETRERRVAKAIEMLEAGVRHP